jgi:hypothetical protein
MKSKHKTLLLALALAASCLTSACTSTRTENGVSIERQRSMNPLNYIPYL